MNLISTKNSGISVAMTLNNYKLVKKTLQLRIILATTKLTNK